MEPRAKRAAGGPREVVDVFGSRWASLSKGERRYAEEAFLLESDNEELREFQAKRSEMAAIRKAWTQDWCEICGAKASETGVVLSQTEMREIFRDDVVVTLNQIQARLERLLDSKPEYRTHVVRSCKAICETQSADPQRVLLALKSAVIPHLILTGRAMETVLLLASTSQVLLDAFQRNRAVAPKPQPIVDVAHERPTALIDNLLPEELDAHAMMQDIDLDHDLQAPVAAPFMRDRAAAMMHALRHRPRRPHDHDLNFMDYDDF